MLKFVTAFINYSSCSFPLPPRRTLSLRRRSKRKSTWWNGVKSFLVSGGWLGNQAYVALLDGSRERALRENSNLRTTLKELEALVDSARERERNNFSNLEALNRNVEEMQRKHSRHKEASLAERGQLHAQLESLTAALHDCSTTNKSLAKHNNDLERRESLWRADSGVVSLSGECDGLKRKVAHLVDEDEALKLKTRVRKLEDENVLLAGEKVRLQTELQEKCTLNSEWQYADARSRKGR
ncbi:MAG: uncharacterized protein KVP18_001369 [Porospora cf. gigantea A]|uniref:uncharacterized protein n=1 Tax=Porospora cf. gigantea A TaxID=2853593 RepID=UPI00355A8E58|nr:MAG: hypothetical protein KVP18_001369 [Porospora cf. gigantea A]